MMMTDINLKDSCTSILKVNKKEKKQICSLAGCITLGCIGIILFILGTLSLFMDPVSIILKDRLIMKKGSYVEYMWEEWPIKNLLKVYIFNITNGDDFLDGTDEKLTLNEIGPYVFRETRSNTNMTYNENGTLSFTPKSTVEFLPELSAGNMNDIILIPNMVVLMIASLSTNFLATIGLESIISSSGQKFIQAMTVKELLISGHVSDFQDYFKYSNATVFNYKFGLLEKLYDSGDEIVTISLNESLGKQYTIQDWEKIPQFKADGTPWEYTRLPCDTINGSYQGGIYSPNTDLGHTIKIYHKSFCRPLAFDYTGIMTLDSGLQGNVYEIPKRALSCNNPENACHCNKTGKEMPAGIVDVSNCFNNMSIGLSLPHFYSGDISLLEDYDGLNPNKKSHSGFHVIQPDIGMEINMSSKIQINFMVGKIKYIKQGKQFSEMNVPILWMDSGTEDLPDTFVNEILLMHKYFPIFIITVSWLLVVSGLVLIVFCSSVLYIYFWKRKNNYEVETFRYLSLTKKENEKNKERENTF